MGSKGSSLPEIAIHTILPFRCAFGQRLVLTGTRPCGGVFGAKGVLAVKVEAFALACRAP